MGTRPRVVTATWTDNAPDEGAYRVQLALGGGGMISQSVLPPKSTTVVYEYRGGLRANTTHLVQVRAELVDPAAFRASSWTIVTFVAPAP